MPQIQVIDSTPRKQEPSEVQQLFSKLGATYKDNEDRVKIGNMIQDYKKNREDGNAWENLQLDLETSDISPTKRLETQKSLNEIRKGVSEKDKALNDQIKSQLANIEKKDKQQKAKLDELKSQSSVEQLYLESGYEPEEAARLAKFDSPTIAVAKAKEKNKKNEAQQKEQESKD